MYGRSPVRELILGGQKSGKSARAERLAAVWLAASPAHSARFLATAQAHDDEMHARIARHRADRAARLPSVQTVEVPLLLADAIAAHSMPQTLLVVDCLTLWLTNCLMPYTVTESNSNITTIKNAVVADCSDFITKLIGAIKAAKGPVVLVSNEIGLGVIPMGREVREFVDALGQLNQAVAQVCERVSFMAAGLQIPLKATP